MDGDGVGVEGNGLVEGGIAFEFSEATVANSLGMVGFVGMMDCFIVRLRRIG